MANAELNKAFKTSAKKLKKVMLALKKASKKEGMEKNYGPNGPLGELAIDLVFPGLSSEVFANLLSTDKNAMQLREVYRFALGKQDPDSMPTNRMNSLDEYLGVDNCGSTFSNIAKATKKFKGKGDPVKGILELAQDSDELKNQISKYTEEDSVSDTKSDVSEEIKHSPLSGTTKALSDTIDTSSLSIEDLAKSRSPKEELM